MFYSKEILTRRTRKHGRFGIVWLAATLGSPSRLRNLSKKEVNSIDLVKACKYVTASPKSLQLTSNLMVGIARIYRQQYHSYYTEVNEVLNSLQKDLAETRVETRKESIDMEVTQARYEDITLEDDPYFEIELMFSKPDIMTQMEFMPSEAPSVTSSDDDDDDDEFRIDFNTGLRDAKAMNNKTGFKVNKRRKRNKELQEMVYNELGIQPMDIYVDVEANDTDNDMNNSEGNDKENEPGGLPVPKRRKRRKI